MRDISIPAIVLTMTILSVQPLYANWGGEAGGSVATGTFKPIGASQVEMLKENLVIRLYRDRAKVDVDYVLHNAGDAVDVTAGFPSLGVEMESTKHREIEDYTIRADGKSVPYARKKGDPAPFKVLYSSEFLDMLGGRAEDDDCSECMLLEWLVSTVHFERGENKRIHIRYESLYAYSDGGFSDDSDYDDDWFRYLLSTAAAWKGPIREGRVIIQAVTVDADKLVVLPKGRFQRTAQGLVWEFHNLKPSMQDNIEVNLNDHRSTIFDYSKDFKTDADGRRFVAEGGKYYLDSHDYVPHDATGRQDYPAPNVRDYKPKTEWRAVRTPGLGESLMLEIKPPAHITQVGIMPGCGANKAEWFSHSRIKELEVAVNGRYVGKSTLPDEYISFWPDSSKAYEIIDLPPYTGDATEIQLTIRGVYPGTKDQVSCISEVLLRQRLKEKPNVQGVSGEGLP
jgi:hypothetical protein